MNYSTVSTATQALDADVSCYPTIHDIDSVERLPLRQVLSEIATGRFATMVERARAFFEAEDDAAYTVAKTALQSFTPAGTFVHRKDEHIEHLNGVLCLDLDDVDDIPGTRAILEADEFTLFCFVSPSGHGLKVGCFSLPGRSNATHRAAYESYRQYVLHTYKLDVKIDPVCLNPSRPCFMSYDTSCYVNEAAQFFHVEPVQGQAEPGIPELRTGGNPVFAGGRNTFLTAYAGKMRKEGHSDAVIEAAVREKNVTHCRPPLPDRELTMLRSMQDWPQPAPDEPWQAVLDLRKDGAPKETLDNLLQILTHHATFAGRLRWNALHDTLLWDEEPCADLALADLVMLLRSSTGYSVTKLGLLEKALRFVGQRHAFDPLQEHLATCAWDGTPRLASWLIDHAGAPDTPVTEWIGTTLVCAMVARALEPGCIQRYVVILEGAENTGKSRLVAALGAPWNRTMLAGLEHRDAQVMARYAWVCEWPELDSLNRAESARIKAFITTTHDSYRQLYTTQEVTYPRRTVFIGTTNTHGYLTGQQGNTRFLPVHTRQIDVEAIAAIRDQLLGEALCNIRDHGYQWWDVPAHITSALDASREERRATSEYETLLSPWVDRIALTQDYITFQMIADGPLNMPNQEGKWSQALQREVSHAMLGIGWERVMKHVGGRTLRVYVRRAA